MEINKEAFQLNEKEPNKNIKKSTYKLIVMPIAIVVILLSFIMAVVIKNNTNTDIESKNNSRSEIQNTSTTNNSKYVQVDSKCVDGKSFTIDIQDFKTNARNLLFEDELKSNSLMQTFKGMYGDEYGTWQSYIGDSGVPYEEIKTFYTKNDKLDETYINRSITIFYNEDKTNVIGIMIWISDYYLDRIGASDETELMREVINCLPSDFVKNIEERISNKELIKEDFDIGIGEMILNDETYHYFLIHV